MEEGGEGDMRVKSYVRDRYTELLVNLTWRGGGGMGRGGVKVAECIWKDDIVRTDFLRTG